MGVENFQSSTPTDGMRELVHRQSQSNLYADAYDARALSKFGRNKTTDPHGDRASTLHELHLSSEIIIADAARKSDAGLDFSQHEDIYHAFSEKSMLAQAVTKPAPGIPSVIRKQLDADAERLRKAGKIDERGHWLHQNPRLPRGQDIAGALKEWLTDTLTPSPGKPAENNLEFLYQFLTGTGKTVQEHADKADPVLKDFIHSPGADAIRKQFKAQGYPACTDQLTYGTYQAAIETVFPHRKDPQNWMGYATALPEEPPNDMIYPDWSSVAAQVGGFGNPPKEYPWAKATAIRCNVNGKPDPHGDHVQFCIINIAGAHSFLEHVQQFKDHPIGSTGPGRSMIQSFQWTEPLPQ